MKNIIFANNVIFLRHGETEWNVQNRTQGHLNSPLTEKGILQAEKAVEKLVNYNFDIIISSPLGRAFETAKIIANRLSIPEITIDDCLSERSLGALQGNTVAESRTKFPYLWNESGEFIHSANIPNGESSKDFLSRVRKAIENLESISQTKNVLVVTHDGVLSAIASHIKNIDFSEVGKFYQFKNCDPVILS